MTDKEILEANLKERQPTECWARVMGYYQSVENYNRGKKQEFNERTWFTEEQAMKGVCNDQRRCA